jgi:dipeptidyl aminopeptidase/acylaminoacyl peptidase
LPFASTSARAQNVAAEQDVTYCSVDGVGPPDLFKEYEFDQQNFAEGTLEEFLGGSPDKVPLQYKKASPITYVRKDAPPILIVQGDRDHETLPEWNKVFDAKLEEVGALHSLVIMQGHFHENFWDEKMVWDFLAAHLRKTN